MDTAVDNIIFAAPPAALFAGPGCPSRLRWWRGVLINLQGPMLKQLPHYRERTTTLTTNKRVSQLLRDLDETAYHEAGHALAATTSGMQVSVEVAPWYGKIETPKAHSRYRYCHGFALYKPARPLPPPFDWVVLAWAGPLAHVHAEAKYCRPSDSNQDDYIKEMTRIIWLVYKDRGEVWIGGGEAHNDRGAIAELGHGRAARKAFDRAVEIVHGNVEVLEQIASRLQASFVGRYGDWLATWGLDIREACDWSLRGAAERRTDLNVTYSWFERENWCRHCGVPVQAVGSSQ